MEPHNIYLNTAMHPTLNFGESTIKALALRGYKITQIVVTHTLQPQPGEGSLCIEYRLVHSNGNNLLMDFQQVMTLASQAALI